MAGGREDGLALTVLHDEGALALVQADIDATGLHLLVLHINPLRQGFLLRVAFTVLDTHSILSQFSHVQPPASEGLFGSLRRQRPAEGDHQE